MITVQAVVFGLFLTLILLVSRRRSQVAKWLLILLFATGLPAMWRIMAAGVGWGTGLADLAVAILDAAALGLLFTPSARAWLRAKSAPPTAETLQRTFE